MRRIYIVVSVAAFSVIISCSDDVNAPGNEIGDPHLAAYYPFSGNAGDSSGHGSDGSLNGPTLTTDRHGNPDAAYSFDSYSSYITVSDTNNFRFADQITVAAWMRPDSQRTQVLVRKSGGPVALFELSLSGLGGVFFKLQNNFAITSGYVLNTWAHVAGTYDGQMMRLYVNGVLKDSLTVPNALTQDGSLLLIGTRSGSHGDTFGGALDEIRIYDRALSASEVSVIAE